MIFSPLPFFFLFPFFWRLLTWLERDEQGFFLVVVVFVFLP